MSVYLLVKSTGAVHRADVELVERPARASATAVVSTSLSRAAVSRLAAANNLRQEHFERTLQSGELTTCTLRTLIWSDTHDQPRPISDVVGDAARSRMLRRVITEHDLRQKKWDATAALPDGTSEQSRRPLGCLREARDATTARARRPTGFRWRTRRSWKTFASRINLTSTGL